MWVDGSWPCRTPRSGRWRLKSAERLPGELKQGISTDEISGAEVKNVGERDENRISTFDEHGRFATSGLREGKDHRISRLKLHFRRHRKGYLAAPASFDLRNPMFIGGIAVHEPPKERLKREAEQES